MVSIYNSVVFWLPDRINSVCRLQGTVLAKKSSSKALKHGQIITEQNQIKLHNFRNVILNLSAITALSEAKKMPPKGHSGGLCWG
jgi:hypothetical protein